MNICTIKLRAGGGMVSLLRFLLNRHSCILLTLLNTDPRFVAGPEWNVPFRNSRDKERLREREKEEWRRVIRCSTQKIRTCLDVYVSRIAHSMQKWSRERSLLEVLDLIRCVCWPRAQPSIDIIFFTEVFIDWADLARRRRCATRLPLPLTICARTIN